MLVGTYKRLCNSTQPWRASGKSSRKGDLNLDLKIDEPTSSEMVERGGE